MVYSAADTTEVEALLAQLHQKLVELELDQMIAMAVSDVQSASTALQLRERFKRRARQA